MNSKRKANINGLTIGDNSFMIVINILAIGSSSCKRYHHEQ